MTSTHILSFIKSTCHATILKDILEDTLPQNEGEIKKDEDSGSRKQEGRQKIPKKGDLTEDGGEKDFLGDGKGKAPQ